MRIEIQVQSEEAVGMALAALYNGSKPQGMGLLHFDPTPMSAAQAKSLLQGGADFDYLKGRVMKINLGEKVVEDASGAKWLPLNTWGYDRDNGESAAANTLKAAGLTVRSELDQKMESLKDRMVAKREEYSSLEMNLKTKKPKAP